MKDIIRLLEISEKNWDVATDLDIQAHQYQYLVKKPLLWSLVYCHLHKNESTAFLPLFIQANDLYVGGMLLEFQNTRCKIMNFFIDKNYQGQGLGCKSFSETIKFIQTFRSIEQITLTINPNNKIAQSFYKKFGFNQNGEINKKGNLVMVLSCKSYNKNKCPSDE